jgi:hypothetical protein
MSDILVKCTRCRHQCMESVWPKKLVKTIGAVNMSESVCPKCGCKTFYDMRPQVAWCWASGLIELGDTMPQAGPDGGGAIQIASGPKSSLVGQITVVARHGRGAKGRELLVPGVPEAEGQKAKADALAEFLIWCGKRKVCDGVVFAAEGTLL